ncbi:MAG: VOC family protein [Myxococcota bacterium]
MLEIVKPQLDVGLVTTDPRVVEFWRDEVGLRLDHVLPIMRGHDQHRFDERGTVVKVNLRETSEADARSGLEELLIARDGLAATRALADPDGNRICFVPTGEEGVTQIGVRIAVRSLARTLAYYREVLGFDEESPSRVRCGDSVLLFVERADAPTGGSAAQRGWLYLTVQVRDCDAEVARIESLGGRVVTAPRNMGRVARMAMVADPDGNLLEISQRASLVGVLPDA